ncbi:putative methyltransferase [Candidatus Planktophila lacus]|nr:putative methyltransferase [Candidatus Planktophila lacus]
MGLLRRVLYFFREIGVDPFKTVNSVKFFPKFLKNLIHFLIQSRQFRIKLSPALNDFQSDSGTAKGHYFWQDLICAGWIFNEKPDFHFDVGSRVDGFIAHLTVFMKVSQLDLRGLNSKVPNLTFLKGDAQKPLSQFWRQFDSVSSLHSIEHFGLGRYGDEIDVNGHVRGLVNISECVKANGLLYVSFPIGKPNVEFNSQRVIHPMWPINLLEDFKLEKFILIPWSEIPINDVLPGEVNLDIKGQAGLYCFRRVR